jgi:hypothetical protein
VAPTSTGGVNLRGSLGLSFGVLTGLILLWGNDSQHLGYKDLINLFI